MTETIPTDIYDITQLIKQNLESGATHKISIPKIMFFNFRFLKL